MSYSIMQAGQSTKGKATGSLKTLSDMEQNREMRNDQAEQQTKNSQMSGAASGAMIGTQIMPGWGTAIGAVVGFAAGSL
ncbi:bacteriocin [Pseudoalteromonas neustonica]|uniref:Bacteriocin n=1 Tax=Pseudoalteromonas neustonica TaxID=1840331 RepID=A0ABY3F849_9GAMM|nr:YMGG-like glycine zipper-containing protein [Pseudoalteromonas neustonica]TVU80211.1 bacteriocin [Pseudoalteromonas neustonica]